MFAVRSSHRLFLICGGGHLPTGIHYYYCSVLNIKRSTRKCVSSAAVCGYTLKLARAYFLSNRRRRSIALSGILRRQSHRLCKLWAHRFLFTRFLAHIFIITLSSVCVGTYVNVTVMIIILLRVCVFVVWSMIIVSVDDGFGRGRSPPQLATECRGGHNNLGTVEIKFFFS